MRALDFTSALYLGFGHPSRSLPPWSQLTLGRPAAMQEFETSRAVAREVAMLAGREAGCLLPSTFVLFWDLLGVLCREAVELFVDAACYPILRWSAEHWAGRGIPLHVFKAHDAETLGRALRRPRRGRPLVLSDGFTPGRLGLAPLREYAALAERHDGLLIVDDTQALGILGAGASTSRPYGSGGGGSLSHLGLAGPHLVFGTSLAKGLGAPVAALLGEQGLLRRFAQFSASREHMSPPSMAAVLAARHALAQNRQGGEARRARLLGFVHRMRAGLRALRPEGGDFPAQTLTLPSSYTTGQADRALRRAGLRAVVQRPGRGHRGRLALLLTATHATEEVDLAAGLLGYLFAPMREAA